VVGETRQDGLEPAREDVVPRPMAGIGRRAVDSVESSYAFAAVYLGRVHGAAQWLVNSL